MQPSKTPGRIPPTLSHIWWMHHRVQDLETRSSHLRGRRTLWPWRQRIEHFSEHQYLPNYSWWPIGHNSHFSEDSGYWWLSTPGDTVLESWDSTSRDREGRQQDCMEDHYWTGKRTLWECQQDICRCVCFNRLEVKLLSTSGRKCTKIPTVRQYWWSMPQMLLSSSEMPLYEA